MDNYLKTSKLRRIPKRFRRTPAVLSFLNIPYNKKHPFWIVNERQLESLFYDFLQKSREVKSQLHPDRNGDAEQFINFNSACDMVIRAFRAKGIGPQTDITVREEFKNRERVSNRAYQKFRARN